RVLVETLANLDKIERLPQEHAASTYAPMLTREHEQINWGQDRSTVVNLIHGLNPWPGAYTTHNGKILKVLRAERLSHTSSVPPGTVVDVDKNHGFTVQTGEGQALITQVQPQGGKKMDASAYARGYGLAVGDKLGE
ncbi:MAG TPA: methionyl-tRNA formyltransferase, partial [Verrucomicrobiae bacterium]|nr:methionyl-tRNA formyltransferase [Verrucomicrobiae bacterium]